MTDNGKVDTVNCDFDLDKVRAIDVQRLSGGGNIVEQSEILARIVIKAPKEWGKASEPETYQNLPIKTYRNLLNDIGIAVANFLQA